MEAIICDQVNKVYGKNRVIKDVNLTIEKGKIYGLLGRNGAGKTTLLSMMSSHSPITSGTITCNGEPVWENRKALSHICFSRELMPSTMSGLNGLKVKDYLKTAELYYPYWDKAMAEELVKKFELDSKKKLNKLSKGMLSMITIIVALASKADYTFLDEPVAGLDVIMREYFYKKLIEEYSESGRTFILSTHIIEEISDVIEEVIFIKDGEVILTENTQELLARCYQVSGLCTVIDEAFQGYKVFHEETMGRSKKLMVMLKNGENLPKGYDISVQNISLQSIFVDLCSID